MDQTENKNIVKKTVMGLPKKKDEANEILAQCYAENLLDMEQYEKRVELIENSTSIEEVHQHIADVPEEIFKKLSFDIPDNIGNKVKNTSSFNRDRAVRKGGTETYLTIMSERYIDNSQLNKENIFTNTIMGQTTLDFTNIDGDYHYIKTVTIMGELRVILSKDMDIEIKATPIMGEIKSKTNLSSDAGGYKKIVLDGLVLMGSIIIRRG